METATKSLKAHNLNSFRPVAQGSRPSASDNAPKGNHNDGLNSSGLVNYYFVFLAVILCVVGFLVFILMRRRNKRVRRMRFNREQGLQRGTADSRGGGGWSNWNPERTRGRYWRAGWRSAEGSREEGLNEHGEAPPPYIPKMQSAEEQQGGPGEADGPAIPLQALSREDAGLKPPDYTEAHTDAVDSHMRNSSASAASASSSRDPEHRTTS